MKEQALEQEQTLEELGSQLSTSKLQLSDMKEEIHRSKVDGAWVKDKTATHCKGCKKEFILTRRKVLGSFFFWRLALPKLFMNVLASLSELWRYILSFMFGQFDVVAIVSKTSSSM